MRYVSPPNTSRKILNSEKLVTNTKKKVAGYIENTSRQDLINLNNKFIVDGEFMNVTVQIRGNDFRDSSYFSWENF